MRRKLLFLFGVALVLVSLDQATKYWILAELTTRFDGRASFSERLSAFYSDEGAEAPVRGYHFQPKRYVNVSDDFFRLRYAENTGAAWGIFRSVDPSLRIPFFALVTLAAIVFITAFFVKLTGRPEEKWAYWGLPLVLSGALGNFVDRVSRGFVIDFLEAHWMDRIAWPSFNVADIAISVGVGMLLLDMFVRRETKPAHEARSA